MGLLKRVGRLSVARVEAFLASVEDPRRLLPQIFRELEECLRQATEREATSLTGVRHAERARHDAQAKVKRMGELAEAAVAKGDEPLAREALRAQVDAELALRLKSAALTIALRTHKDGEVARDRLQRQLDELREKQQEILLRATTDGAGRSIPATDPGGSGGVLDAIARMERKAGIGSAPAAADPLEEGRYAPERDQELDLRLDALKARHQSLNHRASPKT